MVDYVFHFLHEAMHMEIIITVGLLIICTSWINIDKNKAIYGWLR